MVDRALAILGNVRRGFASCGLGALVGIVLAIVSTGSAIAGPLEDAWAACQRGDYATALQIWQPRAARGVALAQNNLGLMYDNGQGVVQDHAESTK